MLPAWQLALFATLTVIQAVGLALTIAAWRTARRGERAASARLEALESRLARLEAPRESRSPVNVRSGGPIPLGPRSMRRADRPGGGPLAGPTLIAVPNLAAAPGPPSPSATAAAELDRRFGAIWAMADAGATAEAIARDVGQPVGQVELILGLRRRLAAPEGGRA